MLDDYFEVEGGPGALRKKKRENCLLKVIIVLLAILLINSFLQTSGATWYYFTDLQGLGNVSHHVNETMYNMSVHFDQRLHRMDRIMSWIEHLANLPPPPSDELLG